MSMHLHVSSGMKNPTEMTIIAWARLVRAREAAVSRAERALKEAGLPPLAWYDILLEVERAGKDGIRQFELQDELLLPQYGLSRLIDRISRAGYLARHSCAEDGRGHQLVITPSGHKIRKRMWSVYSKAIEGAVGQKLSARETATLAELLGKLI